VAHVTLITPLNGQFIFHLLVLATIHLFTNFEVSSLNYIKQFWQTDPLKHGIM